MSDEPSQAKISEEKLGELERLAKAATPGPWRECNKGECVCGYIYGESGPVAWAISHKDEELSGGSGYLPEQANRNRAHIAATNPATMLQLLAHIRALQASLEDARREWAKAEAERDALEKDKLQLVDEGIEKSWQLLYAERDRDAAITRASKLANAAAEVLEHTGLAIYNTDKWQRVEETMQDAIRENDRAGEAKEAADAKGRGGEEGETR